MVAALGVQLIESPDRLRPRRRGAERTRFQFPVFFVLQPAVGQLGSLLSFQAAALF